MRYRIGPAILLVIILALGSVLAATASDKGADKKEWVPADIDETVPHADLSQPCPLPKILEETGHQVRKLVENLQRFSAHEKLEYWEVGSDGQPSSVRTTTFTYVADIREVRPGQFGVDEYRNDFTDVRSFPTHLATTGTAAFALIFHPFYIRDFTVTCEGLTQLDGHAAWQVHFVQKRPNNFRYYRAANNLYRLELKGRAWIAQDSHEVLRLETDLLRPILEVRLMREHVSIDYGPVRFARHNVTLWLPKSATIYMDSRKHRYGHRHTFTDYKLFWVDTQQSTKVPDAP